MGGDQPTQTTTTQLSPDQQQILNYAMPGIATFAASPPPKYQVAGFNPTQTQSQADVLSGAGTAGNIADWAQGGATTTLPAAITANTGTPFTAAPSVAQSSDIFNDPGIWNPANNAGVEAAINAATRPTWQNLVDTALPAVRGGAVTAGGYGGSRQGIAEGLATRGATQAAQDAASKIAEDEYAANLAAVNARYGTNIGASEAERQADTAAETARYGTDASRAATNLNAWLATYGLAPTLQQEALLPGYTEANVGDVQQQQTQQELNAQYANKMAPFLQSQEILSLLQGVPGGTTVSTGNTPRPNPVTGALGGAATGAALGSVIPGGAAVGAGIGGLAGTLPFLFSHG